jgi:hypothetical protein
MALHWIPEHFCPAGRRAFCVFGEHERDQFETVCNMDYKK